MAAPLTSCLNGGSTIPIWYRFSSISQATAPLFQPDPLALKDEPAEDRQTLRCISRLSDASQNRLRVPAAA